MTRINYTIELLSDTESNSGFGSATMQGYIARDLRGRPMLPASSLKGLIRKEIMQLEEVLKHKNLTKLLCGEFGVSAENEGLFRVNSSYADNSASSENIMTITRTCIDFDTGTAKENSLRTTEAIRKGVVLKEGYIQHQGEKDSWIDLALRIALMGIRHVGGNNSRGSGACRIKIENESRKPSELLKALSIKKIEKTNIDNRQTLVLSGESTWCELIFEAEQPVCCPAYPVKSNTIESSFEIPASAVLGALLTHIGRTHSDLADELIIKDKILAYPLLPVADKQDIPYRISLSHKIAKLIVASSINADDFQDEAIQEIDWTTQGANNPLKATDGLLIKKDKKVLLWCSRDIARQLLAHGSRRTPDESGEKEERGLYEVESVVSRTWKAFVSLPIECLNFFKEPMQVAFGKQRTVLGGGVLHVQKIDSSRPLPMLQNDLNQKNVFILQSPVVIKHTNPEESFKNVINDWVMSNGLNTNLDLKDISIWANYGFRFGWNRVLEKGYAGVKFVALPGSVFKIKGNLDFGKIDLAVRKGLGVGSGSGFGAISLHPGVAVSLYEGNAKQELNQKESSNNILKLVKSVLENKSNVVNLSPSQWYSFADSLYTSQDKAREFRDTQFAKRDDNTKQNWKDNKELIKTFIDTSKDEFSRAEVMRAIKFAADLSGINRNEELS